QDSTLSQWNAEQLYAIAAEASAALPTGMPDLPTLDSHHPARLLTQEQAHAEQQAILQLQASRLLAHHFKGQGGVRTLAVAQQYTLSGHPSLSGRTFVPLRIRHLATNNLNTGDATN